MKDKRRKDTDRRQHIIYRNCIRIIIAVIVIVISYTETPMDYSNLLGHTTDMLYPGSSFIQGPLAHSTFHWSSALSIPLHRPTTTALFYLHRDIAPFNFTLQDAVFQNSFCSATHV